MSNQEKKVQNMEQKARKDKEKEHVKDLGDGSKERKKQSARQSGNGHTGVNKGSVQEKSTGEKRAAQNHPGKKRPEEKKPAGKKPERKRPGGPVNEADTARKKGERPSEEETPKKNPKKKQKITEKVQTPERSMESRKSDLDGYDLPVSENVDGFADDGEGKRMKKRKGMKIFLITLACIAGIAALIYLGASVFFMSHFYYETTINGIDFSMKTADYVEQYMEGQVKDYTLTIVEKQDVEETISGQDISLVYQKSDEIQKALEAQNPFLWPMVFFEAASAEVKVDVAYDTEALEQKILALKCITEVEQTEPISAYPKFDGEQFVVEPEQTGMKVDQEILKQKVNEYVSGFQHTLNMEEEGCYMLPKYTSESPEVQAACDTMNEYCKASITYTMGSTNEVVDKALISTWLTCDEELNVTFNTDAVTQYMTEFGKKYDTVGKTRSITTPTGKTAEVTGGTYGWSVDEAAEAQALIASIQNGEVVTKEPAYVQTAASHEAADWGTTYIEVDLSAQHVWYITDGNVAFEADVVTGLPTPSRETPQGVYDILEKLRNKTLRGAKLPDGSYEYETPVSYWMRVTYSGVGFHDATWQPYFGGSRYLSGGSHGCINMSYSDAARLYELIPVRVPVVIHY